MKTMEKLSKTPLYKKRSKKRKKEEHLTKIQKPQTCRQCGQIVFSQNTV